MAIQYPTIINKSFAVNGDKVLPSTESSPILANQETGFPLKQSQPLAQGGLPVTREQMNGSFNYLSDPIVYMNAGGTFKWSQLIIDAGGYPVGARIMSDDGLISYTSLVDNNVLPLTDASWISNAGQALKAPIGYSKTIGGIITQWGTVVCARYGTATFPVAFPNLCASVTATPAVALTTAGDKRDSWMVSSVSKTNCVIFNNFESTPSVNMYWMAVGY